MINTEILDIDIAIIGAGPSGIAAAIELSKLGYKNLIVFEREDEAGGTPRHCGHLGFGMFEFGQILTGPSYAKKLRKKAKDNDINIYLGATLVKIDNDILLFSTPEGMKQYRAKRTLLAMGARETPRPERLISGIRSPNIITTGALQRFTYLEQRRPFSEAVIVGSEIVSFSAMMTARHANIKIVAIIEEENEINSHVVLKYLAKYIFKIPIYTNTKIMSINGENKEIRSLTVLKDGQEETILCNGIVFTGHFTPESSILKKSFDDFNLCNNSVYISQNFQTSKLQYFASGNVLRGALTAFKCYFEGKKVAKYIDNSLKQKKNPTFLKIDADKNIDWYYPSLVDMSSPRRYLTKVRLVSRKKGLLKVLLNGKEVQRQNISPLPYFMTKIDCPNINLKETDNIRIIFETKLYVKHDILLYICY